MQSPSLLTRSPVALGGSKRFDELSKTILPETLLNQHAASDQEQQWRAKVLEAGAGQRRAQLVLGTMEGAGCRPGDCCPPGRAGTALAMPVYRVCAPARIRRKALSICGGA